MKDKLKQVAEKTLINHPHILKFLSMLVFTAFAFDFAKNKLQGRSVTTDLLGMTTSAIGIQKGAKLADRIDAIQHRPIIL